MHTAQRAPRHGLLLVVLRQTAQVRPVLRIGPDNIANVSCEDVSLHTSHLRDHL